MKVSLFSVILGLCIVLFFCFVPSLYMVNTFDIQSDLIKYVLAVIHTLCSFSVVFTFFGRINSINNQLIVLIKLQTTKDFSRNVKIENNVVSTKVPVQ